MLDFYAALLVFADKWPLLVFTLILSSFLTIYSVAGVIFRIVNRLCRVVMVSIRGWPPEHLDADGDFWAHHLAEANQPRNDGADQ